MVLDFELNISPGGYLYLSPGGYLYISPDRYLYLSPSGYLYFSPSGYLYLNTSGCLHLCPSGCLHLIPDGYLHQSIGQDTSPCTPPPPPTPSGAKFSNSENCYGSENAMSPKFFRDMEGHRDNFRYKNVFFFQRAYLRKNS